MECECGQDLEYQTFEAGSMQDGFVGISVKCPACEKNYYAFLSGSDFKSEDEI